MRGLARLFRPRAVAVVGASRRPHSIGREILLNLLEGGFQGPVYPVNRRAEVVCSIRAHPRVSAIDGPVDLAVVCVPRTYVPAVARDCARKGVGAMVVITAGFREAGEEGRRLEARLEREVRRAGIRLIGPNCMGVLNTDPRVSLNATFAAVPPLPGNVAFATQSGALGEAILADAREMNVGISLFASIGNVVDVDAADLVDAFGADPRTDVILLYLESFGEPQRFLSVARRVARRKPIVVVKAGRSSAGARAAASHTGSLAGADIAADSLLEQCGVLRAGTVEELFTMAKAFSRRIDPRRGRTVIVTNAGGPGVLATDACVARGVPLAELSGRTRGRLARVLPKGAATANPIDLIADADARRFERALDAVLPDEGVDVCLAVFVSPVTTDAPAVARAIAEARSRHGKPILACFMGKERASEGPALLEENGIPVFRFPEAAAIALGGLVRARRLRSRPRGRMRRPRARPAEARRILEERVRAGGGFLPAEDALAVLSAYGIPFAPSREVGAVGEAIAFARRVGYPVVLKAESPRFTHKTDVGAVRLHLTDADELFQAWEQLQRTVAAIDPDARIRVQKEIPGRLEVIVGAARDPEFGMLVLFGLGGVHVEVLRDFAVRVLPVSDVDVREMIRSIRGWPLLEGTRGVGPVDVGFVEEVVLRVARLVEDHDVIEEIDLNPLILGPDRRRSAVVDCRIRVRGREAAVGRRS